MIGRHMSATDRHDPAIHDPLRSDQRERDNRHRWLARLHPVDDLQADWGVARHQRWVTDTPARVGRQPEPAGTAQPDVEVVPVWSGKHRRADVSERLDRLQRRAEAPVADRDVGISL